MNDLIKRTEFKSGRALSAKETNINTFLHAWGGTTKGLGSEWLEETEVKISRPICKKCGKYRCCH